MGYFLDSFRALGTTLKNVFRPPTTVQFPKEIRPRAERYRASFALLHDEQGDELCIGCLQCERICPSQVISIKAAGKRESPVTGKKRGYADDFTLDLSACIFCELCVQVCPVDAIVMTRTQEIPGYAREDLVLTMDRLYANEKKMTRAWADGSKLMGMQTPPKPPKPAAAPATATAAAPASEAKPAEAKPAEAKPAEAKPAEAKPAEAKPAEAKPAEAPASGESDGGTTS